MADTLVGTIQSALDEFDNVRWADMWEALAGAGQSGLAEWSRSYVGYVRDDLVKAVDLAHQIPLERSGAEPSGVIRDRSADAPRTTSSDGGSPETERAMSDVDSPDRSLLHDPETCPRCLPALERLGEAVERIRANHDRSSGHVPTTVIGYCGESDGISAVYCETGVLLAAIP